MIQSLGATTATLGSSNGKRAVHKVQSKQGSIRELAVLGGLAVGGAVLGGLLLRKHRLMGVAGGAIATGSLGILTGCGGFSSIELGTSTGTTKVKVPVTKTRETTCYTDREVERRYEDGRVERYTESEPYPCTQTYEGWEWGTKHASGEYRAYDLVGGDRSSIAEALKAIDAEGDPKYFQEYAILREQVPADPEKQRPARTRLVVREAGSPSVDWTEAVQLKHPGAVAAFAVSGEDVRTLGFGKAVTAAERAEIERFATTH